MKNYDPVGSKATNLMIKNTSSNIIKLFFHKYQIYILGALVCLFILVRIGLLSYGHVHFSHPAFDETSSGALACDLLDGGLRGPLFTYQ